MVLTKNDEAVSPVIGTVLMVAITVILAAVIAMFVFGSTGNVQKTKIVATTVQLDPDESILIMYQGGQDDGALTSLTITAPNGIVWYTSGDGTVLTESIPPSPVKPNIGASLKIPTPPGGWPPGPKHVLVVGSFGDSADQVITDSYL
jgi:flagellin-like protein